MSGLGLEIDDEAGENRIDSGNLAKTPTAMQAITTFGQRQQSVNVLPSDLPRSNQFLELFFHIVM